MRLTKAQHRFLDGTAAQRTSMRILLAVGEISEAPRLVPITSAHVSGASYKMIGDAGLEFLEDFARDARVVVPTTVNPLGTDLAQWRDLGIPPEFAENQERIARAYEQMGVAPVYSCTPYLLGVRPALGEHVAWSESNAVCFANSVLGARTNREGGPSALASAVIGATPEYGLHVDESREPTVIAKLTTKPRGVDYSLIGLLVGERVGDGLPFFRGLPATEADLKWLGAALASSGSCAMFHVEGITPEARKARVRGLPSITITRADLTRVRREYSDGTDAEVIALGSPQLSTDELRDIALRVAVQPGGCSGLRYAMYLDDQLSEKDVAEEQFGVRIVIDKMSVPYLSEAKIDFVDSLEASGFTIDNPVATGSCACGHSFH